MRALHGGRVIRIGAVLVCIALLFGVSSGAVWCRGEDGHLRLERGGDSCCELAAGQGVTGVSPCEGLGLCSDVSHLEGCGNCVDVPLLPGADKVGSAAATVAPAVLPASTPAGHAPTPELISRLLLPTPLRSPAACQSVLRL